MAVDGIRLEELTRSMCAEPGDDAPVAVCADYLEQQGDPRAGYLRDQLRLRSRPEDPHLLAALRRAYPGDAWIAGLELAGVLECDLTALPASWWGGQIPGRDAQGTYTRFEYAKLPRLPVEQLDGSLAWLRENPLPKSTTPAESVDPESWRTVVDALVGAGHLVPPSLRALMEDPQMQASIPTPTSNYFISAKPDDDEIDAGKLQPIAETDAVFLPVYSDQQCCACWGVWLAPGEPYAPVLSAAVELGEEEDEIRYTELELAAPDANEAGWHPVTIRGSHDHWRLFGCTIRRAL